MHPPWMLSALEPQFDALTLAAATLTTGDSGVGKSSLLLRFSDDSFENLELFSTEFLKLRRFKSELFDCLENTINIFCRSF